MSADGLVYPRAVPFARRPNEQEWATATAPPIEVPRSNLVLNVAMSMLWAYAVAAQEDGWVDLAEIYEEHRPLDPDDWESAREWLDEEGLVEDRDVDPDGFARADVTPLGYSVLRWWGWEDVERAENPSQIRPGDFVVLREPETRRYYVAACGARDCLTLVGPAGGASSPSSAAMWARRLGGPEARVWLLEREDTAFPISRAANVLVAKERLSAV